MPQHVVVEDYDHYIQRKNKSLKWVPILAIILLIILVIIISDFRNNYPDQPKAGGLILFEELYNNCITNCSGVFEEGEEMIQSCEIIRRDQNKIGLIDCAYKGLIYGCSCVREGEDNCQQQAIDYLKEMKCIK